MKKNALSCFLTVFFILIAVKSVSGLSGLPDTIKISDDLELYLVFKK